LTLLQAKLDAQWKDLSEDQRATLRFRKARKLVEEKHTAHVAKLERMLRQHYLRNPEWDYPEAFLLKQGYASHQLKNLDPVV